MKTKHILVALGDPATKASPAVTKALAIARKTGATVTLFHSLYSPYVAGEQFYSPEALQRDIEIAVNSRKAALAKLTGAFDDAGVPVHVRVRWDYPVHESIVREVMREEVDLVVAESHRHARAARVVLSNTDWQLIRTCPCPVLFVKTAQPYDRTRVLAAVDPLHAHAKPGALDADILAIASDFATTFGGRMHVVHCHLPPAPMLAGGLGEPMPLPIEVAQAQFAQVKAAFEKLLAPYELGPKRMHLRTGAAVVELPDAAESLACGLVVMGAVSRTGLKRLFIGSTAERVIDRLGCDVLIVKPAGFRSPVPKRPSYKPVVLPPL